MHVGFSPIFQNPDNVLPDHEVCQRELALCDLAEPLGFDSIWQPEHHFTDYEMTPDVLQFLTYMAGRTKHVKLGAMVVVLPWHDPVRVVEQIVLLDHFSGGRAVLGMGRGLGAEEFGGFRIDMNNTREIFVESAEAIVSALKTGYIEYDGKHIKQPRRQIRPGPFKTFEGRTIGAGLSPETMPILARLGAGSMIFPLKNWEEVRDTLGGYRDTWVDIRPGTTPPKSLLACHCLVHKDAGKAKDLAYKYVGGYLRTVVKHYDMGGEKFANTKGYEFYAKNAEAFRGAALEQKVEDYVNLMPWGTPEQFIEKMHKIDEIIDVGALVCHFAFAGMPYDLAEENMRLFAREVLPELKAWDKGPFAEAAEFQMSAVAAE
ncbi:LLM class flavin-dependent oxidoreductase [Sphingobium sp.]|uniref:LLM class flavin-dependent oxidoreductase n=1 Tax=Sphingobium sp. TaxID=1912891 RepID=UPI003B3AEC19